MGRFETGRASCSRLVNKAFPGLRSRSGSVEDDPTMTRAPPRSTSGQRRLRAGGVIPPVEHGDHDANKPVIGRDGIALRQPTPPGGTLRGRADSEAKRGGETDGSTARATNRGAREFLSQRQDVASDIRHTPPCARIGAERCGRDRGGLWDDGCVGHTCAGDSRWITRPIGQLGRCRKSVATGPQRQRPVPRWPLVRWRGRPPQAHRPGIQRDLPKRDLRFPPVPVGHRRPGDQYVGHRGCPRHLHDDRELVSRLRIAGRLHRPYGSDHRPIVRGRAGEVPLHGTGSRATVRRSSASRSAGMSRMPCS